MALNYWSPSIALRSRAINRKRVASTLPPNYIVALAGNPNTGKSTVFNALTGMKQHTGNWPGKTVTQTKGFFSFHGKTITLVDLPGMYSLLANSPEEEIARDFICFGKPDLAVVVVDCTCLERNLNLVLQILEITPRVVLCANMADEAKRKNLRINFRALQEKLGIPVIPTAARSGKGLQELKKTICLGVNAHNSFLPPLELEYPAEIEAAIRKLESDLGKILSNGLSSRWVALKLIDGDKSLLSRISSYLQEGCRKECVEHYE